MEIVKKVELFLTEEKGQATIEYFLILGSAMVAAVMIASSYYKVGYTARQDQLSSTSEISNTLCEYMGEALKNAGFLTEYDFC